jgi:hypothetical protein
LRAQAFLPRFVTTSGGGGGGAGAAFDLAAATPTILQILKVSWTISAACVAVASGFVAFGARRHTTWQHTRPHNEGRAYAFGAWWRRMAAGSSAA